VNRKLVSTAVFSCLGVLAYVAWLRYESGRMERSAWAEVADPS